jgi:hypothetical protein
MKQKNKISLGDYIGILSSLAGIVIIICQKFNIESNMSLFGFILGLYGLHVLNSADIDKIEKRLK